MQKRMKQEKYRFKARQIKCKFKPQPLITVMLESTLVTPTHTNMKTPVTDCVVDKLRQANMIPFTFS